MRCTPLRPDVVAVLKQWLLYQPGEPGDPVFPSSRGGHLSADALQRLVSRNAEIARLSCPSLKKKSITPHTLRHYMPFLTISGNEGFASVLVRCALVVEPSPVTTRHSFVALQSIQEAEKFVCRPVASWLAVSQRCLRKSLLLHRKCRFEIDLRGFHRFMPEPQCNHGTINARLQKVHGHRMPQTVNGDLFLLQRWTNF
ncbi:putative integrase/recombinase (plasmid) [Cupriavidus necator H16]|uniref:Putative integrase/recombinase n=1 Tax=Cupriavidus necator (strain ATCC 17699 / DSM 428 / KCTC 22496 / NCIMB 10442 / H16 / Stanier 337) TaxID=381666 RepID=Q7WXJ3_CUPNH|nr:putative integrase/recombinase [Cupriavidus necator H16]